LEDAGGQTRVGTETSLASPQGKVSMTVVDDLAQESGRRFAFAGGGFQSALIWGGPIDLSRQANGEMALSLRYRVDASPSAAVVLAAGQGNADQVRGGVDITRLLADATIGQWATLKVRLSCFRNAGAELAALERPFQVITQGTLSLSVSEIRLASNEGDAICPSE
jgi:beta-glucosidase